MRILKFSVLLTILNLCVSANAQNNENLCTKGLSYGELVNLFQISTSERLVNILQQKCFEEYRYSNEYSIYSAYERKYEKSDEGSITSYNEFLTMKNGIAYEYKCSELAICEKLLKQINDNAIYYTQSLIDTNAYIYT